MATGVPAVAGRAFHPLVERIRRDIFQRRLSPGDRLPHERAMAEAFGVGRSAVREALRVLEMQGLVRVRHGYQGGVFVAEPGAERFVEALGTWLRHEAVRVDELYQARLLVEPALARVAAERDGPALARVLLANVEQAEACRAAGRSPFSLNVEFHALIAAAGGNRVVNGIMRTLLDLLVERRAEAEPAAAGLSDRAVGDHHDLLRATGAGDGRLVEALMLSHLARVHAPPAAAPDGAPPALWPSRAVPLEAHRPSATAPDGVSEEGTVTADDATHPSGGMDLPRTHAAWTRPRAGAVGPALPPLAGDHGEPPAVQAPVADAANEADGKAPACSHE